MADSNISDATYFFCMGAKEDTYHKDDKTVEYDLVLTRLSINGTPCTLFDWFLELWKIVKENEAGAEAFILSTLNIPTVLYVHMIWCAFDEDSMAKLASTPVTDNASLVAHLKEFLLCERKKNFNANSLYVRSTAEFDYEYAFFKPSAVGNNELGEHLTKYLKVSEEGEVEATQTTVRWSAYL